MDDFYRLGKNYGLDLNMIRPSSDTSATTASSSEGLNSFRKWVIHSTTGGPVPTPSTADSNCSCSTCTSPQSSEFESFGSQSPDCTVETTPKATVMVVSFSRSELGQTGDGHFSPIGEMLEFQNLIAKLYKRPNLHTLASLAPRRLRR